MDDHTLRQQELQARILEKNKFFEGFLTNPDFARWKEEVVEERLNFLHEDLLSVDTGKPEFEKELVRKFIAFKEAVYTYETIFAQKVDLSRRARVALKQLDERD